MLNDRRGIDSVLRRNVLVLNEVSLNFEILRCKEWPCIRCVLRLRSLKALEALHLVQTVHECLIGHLLKVRVPAQCLKSEILRGV